MQSTTCVQTSNYLIRLILYYLPKVIHLPDGSLQHVTYTGTVILQPNLILTNVMYLANFKCNMLSINSLGNTSKVKVTFYHNKCVLQQSDDVIVVGKAKSGLYYLSNTSQIYLTTCNNTVESSAMLWYLRLGHISSFKLSHIDVFKVHSTKVLICTVCPLSKQQRKHFLLARFTPLCFLPCAFGCLGTL